MTLRLKAPVKLQLSKSGKYYNLNLNNYRNWHYRTSNNLKQRFKDIILKGLKSFNEELADVVRITYTLYVNDNRKKDLANVLAVVDKFLCDALIVAGVIPDDNYNHLVEVVYSFGGKVEGEAYVDVLVEAIS